MQCDDGTELEGGGINRWGTWNSSTFQQCPPSTYLCGVQALILPTDNGIDDMGMNQIKFLCCKSGTLYSWLNSCK